MKLSLNWLKDYIDPKLSTDKLIDRLTMAGLEVEGVESIGGDTVLEIEITPNRPDCLSILGLAREIGAITGKTVNLPKIKDHKTAVLKNLIHIVNIKDCSRYIGTLLVDVEIKDSPQAMKQHLSSLGIKAINNAADITNYVLMEMGQPLHVFDYDKLAGGKIVVRRAKDTESITTIDGVERKLDSSILVIADAEKPVAIAGIMGGKDTEITAQTKNILLESAHFDMGLIRRSSRSLGLRSDSSYRFERNVNLRGVLTGANRATDLLLQLTGGHLSGRSVSKLKTISVPTAVRLNIYDIDSLLGISVTTLKVKAWLSGLGFKVSAYNGKLGVTVPVDRPDIQQEVDVIEEIARMVGFDRLPSKLPVIKTSNVPVDKRPRELKDKVRRILTARGIDEIITLSMINTKALAKSKMTEMPAVRIFNPLSQDQELMRPVMLPSFLQVVSTNFNRGQKDLRLFEIGKTYFKDKEKETLAILLTGRRSHDWRSSKKDAVEIFDLKGALEKVVTGTTFVILSPSLRSRAGSKKDLKASEDSSASPQNDRESGSGMTNCFDPACAAAIIIEGKQIGVLGKVDREVLNNWDIKHQDIYFAELDLDEVLFQPAKPVKYQPISEFPAIIRDVSLAVRKEVSYKQIEEICHQQGGDVLNSLHFIELYLGDKIQSGYKGIVFSCHYQSNTRTLREDEVSSVHERILQALTQNLAAIRR